MFQTLNAKKIFTTITIATASFAASTAQAGLGYGIKGGLNFTNSSTSYASGYSASSTSSYGLGYEAGLSFAVPALPVGLMVDVLYAHRTIGSSSGSSVSFNQVYVPAMLDFGAGPLMINLGAYYAMGFGNISSGSYSLSYDTFGLNTSDYGLVAGLGAKLVKLSVEVRYNFGLANNLTSTYLAANPGTTAAKSRSIDLLVGYWF